MRLLPKQLTRRGSRAILQSRSDVMEQILFVLMFIAALVGAWFWGKVSDPRKGGAVGCCGCGRCLTAGHCVMRGNLPL